MRARARYTLDQVEQVRREYGARTAAQLAREIHGTPRAARAIYRLAYLLGLRKQPHHAPAFLAQVRRLHARGLNDAEIARALGVDRRRVCRVRHDRLGLPRNEASILASRRRAVRTQLARLGLRHGGDLRRWAFRNYARRHGWPEDLRPREVQILNVLAAGGPMTRKELARAIGMPTDQTNSVHGGPKLLVANGPGGTYTATLLRRGLIIRVGRKQQGYRYEVVYQLALTAERRFG